LSPERWRKIEELYHAAIARDPAARVVFLDSACGSDAELRTEVESLLRREGKAAEFLESRTHTAEVSPTLPTQVGPYRVMSRLGAGGMGEVYRAHDSKLGRDVALKALPREFAAHPERLARFRREARLLAALNHPNIAAIYGLEESHGVTCLVLELVEGEDLRGPMPVKQALEYARQVAEALEAAHAQEIIHRDLKPANVKVTPQGRVKVLDFGLAKALWASNDNVDLSAASTVTVFQTAAGQISGTPPYMSPEQATGREVDRRTDVWAFGCLLYELLSGKRAFGGATHSEILARILAQEPDWNALPAKTPPKIRELIKRCLRRDATSRLQQIRDARIVIERVQRKDTRWVALSIAAMALVIVAIATGFFLRGPARPGEVSEWVKLTDFPDSVSQPALSPDGRMLAFVRGPGTFLVPGQIYVKPLPNGEPVQLTHDASNKMSPTFSPDGSSIAYSMEVDPTNPGSHMDMWLVPVIRGEPRPWLRNASGLVWLDSKRVLFSETKEKIHMGVVSAEESGAGKRDVYLPASTMGMAHRSYPSPDRKMALIVEMDNGPWQPCRLVPLDGSSPGHAVGPPGARCTFAAWSPDGKWMYFSSAAGGTFHTWRQRYPDGRPEQITAGLTEEQGIAIAPDGKSLVTAAALKQSTVWVHDDNGDRQVSAEGYSYDPRFTPDGKKLLYRILRGSVPTSDGSELRIVDLLSGETHAVLPGLLISGPPGWAYDLSPDGQRVVAVVVDHEGKRGLWMGDLDGRPTPRQIPNISGHAPRIATNGDVFFVGEFVGEKRPFPLYEVHSDGTGLQKIQSLPNPEGRGGLFGLSPDGRWLATRDATATLLAAATEGAALIKICADAPGNSRISWSTNGKEIFLSVPTAPIATELIGRTYVVPLAPGKVWPTIPPGGFRSLDDMATRTAAKVIEAYDVTPGPRPGVYAFSRASSQRNLYRVPIR